MLKGKRISNGRNNARKIFQQFKHCLASQPVISKPKTREPLYLYVAVSNVAVSGVLIKEDRGVQNSIFYISKTMEDAETRKLMEEKLVLAVIISTRKLRPYFQPHIIIIMTTQPLRTIMHNPNQSGKLTKWAIELSEYDI